MLHGAELSESVYQLHKAAASIPSWFWVAWNDVFA